MRGAIGLGVGMWLAAGGALAQSGLPASSERMRMLETQSRLLDGRLAQQYSHSARLLPPSTRRDGAIPRWRGGYAGPWLEAARRAARRHRIPEDLFLRLVQRESAWDAAAVSHKGAVGLAQLMPGTAALLRVDIAAPEQNLEGGARYLRMMHDRFGSWRLALAAYNAGPEAVARHGGVPPYTETRAYVVAILGN